MEPGDMVFYESHSLIHGRPFPLKGRYMANIFVHFEPFDVNENNVAEADTKFQMEAYRALPLYILPGSPEEENWREENPHGWSKYVSALEEAPPCNIYAARGMFEELKAMGSLDTRLLHFEDPNGWAPVSKERLCSCFYIAR
jgi:hypothetical protein